MEEEELELFPMIEDLNKKIGLLCYDWCPHGYTRRGVDCHQNCPAGFRDDGLFCRNVEYGVGGGYPWKFRDGFNDRGEGCLEDAKMKAYNYLGIVSDKKCNTAQQLGHSKKCNCLLTEKA